MLKHGDASYENDDLVKLLILFKDKKQKQLLYDDNDFSDLRHLLQNKKDSSTNYRSNNLIDLFNVLKQHEVDNTVDDLYLCKFNEHEFKCVKHKSTNCNSKYNDCKFCREWDENRRSLKNLLQEKGRKHINKKDFLKKQTMKGKLREL